jgi:uncharacterized membrane protein
MRTFLRYLFLALFCLFFFAYPFAVTGVAFDVKPPFSLDWAGSALLFLEGTLLIVSAMLLYGHWRALLAGLCVILLSYFVETIGVNTGIPFGHYYYTPILFPALPGGVPLAVMFAWVLIVFGGYGIVAKREAVGNRAPSMRDVLFAALLAAMLDLAIEPVASHVVYYWRWLEPGQLSYYGVPLANFVAWFVVALLLLLLLRWLFGRGQGQGLQATETAWRYLQKTDRIWWLVPLTPIVLFSCSLFMFGLVDLTHGYYWGALCALGAGAIVYLNSSKMHGMWNA